MKPTVISVADLAKRLSVSQSTIKRQVRSGEIPSFKVGARRLVPVAWVESVEGTR